MPGLDLAYLAMGSVDLFFDSGLHIWDYAGPALIVTEVRTDIMTMTGSDTLTRREEL